MLTVRGTLPLEKEVLKILDSGVMIEPFSMVLEIGPEF